MHLGSGQKSFEFGTSGSNSPPYSGKGQIPHPLEEGLTRIFPSQNLQFELGSP